MYFLNCFWLYSIFGYLVESICYILFKWNGESGILYGPWTPLYGFGSIIIIIINNFILKNFKEKKFLKIIILFIFNMVALSLIEYIGGTLIEKLFNTSWWDYSDHKFNIGKYVSLEMSIIWGMSSVLFIYIIKPIFDKFIKKIPNYISFIFIFSIILDLFLTIIKEIFN